jgi:hypothetical protein
MFVPALLVGCGLFLGARTRPKTRVKKLKAIGSKTGVEYEVEKLPEADIIVVRHVPTKTCMALRKKERKWWSLKAVGNERAIAAMNLDFDVQYEPKAPPEALSA